MLILGLADNHDSGAALVRCGELEGGASHLVAAVGQERLDRRKNSGAFPLDAIRTVLDMAGASVSDVERVAFGTAFTPSALLRLLPGPHAKARGGGNFSFLLNLYVAYQSALRRGRLEGLETRACRALLRRRLDDAGLSKARLTLHDHHEAHAHSAWRSQPSAECLVFTLDAMGDGLSAAVWLGRGGRLDRLDAQSGLASVGLFYSRVTEYLGFIPNRHEGKVTGLAALARPPEELLIHLRSLLRFEGGRFSRFDALRPQAVDDRFFSFLSRFSREEIAAATQVVLEQAVVAWVEHWVERSGVRVVALAGGTFANVRLNHCIARSPWVESVFVYPNMGDGGLAVGAALAEARHAPAPIETLYLGPAPTPREVEEALRDAGITPAAPPSLLDRVVDLLVEGRVVARCAGGMEWGPRALGNRSIFYRPDVPDVNQWLNKRLRRSEFMPFAPILRRENADRCFTGASKAPEASRFMTLCFEATPWFRERCPGVVHVDGSARPQILSREENPEVYDLLLRFEERTGLPALVNTSFNMHEEPIVCTARDAVRAWKQASLDALILGDQLLEAPSPSPGGEPQVRMG